MDGGVTPLYLACSSGHLSTVAILLLNKADINKAEGGGLSPLAIAWEKGHRDVLLKLLEEPVTRLERFEPLVEHFRGYSTEKMIQEALERDTLGLQGPGEREFDLWSHRSPPPSPPPAVVFSSTSYTEQYTGYHHERHHEAEGRRRLLLAHHKAYQEQDVIDALKHTGR